LKKYILFLLIISSLFYRTAFGQDQQSRAVREEEIIEQLYLLADSTIASLNETVDFSLSNASVQELIRGIAETHSLNVSVGSNLDSRISNNFNNARVIHVFVFLVKNYNVDIRFINNILIFSKYEAPPKPYVAKPLKISYDQELDRITIDLNRDSISLFTKRFTDITGNNVIVSPELRGQQLNGYVRDVSPEEAIRQIAYMNNIKYEKEDDFLYLKQDNTGQQDLNNPVNRNNPGRRTYQASTNNRRGPARSNITPVYLSNDTLYNANIENTALTEVLRELGEVSGANFAFLKEPEENVSLVVENVELSDLLSVLFLSSKSSYKQFNDKTILVGEENQQGIRYTELVKLKLRSVEELDKSIPAGLLEGVNLQVFTDLNAIILSGGQGKVAEVRSFIEMLDQPVPNVAIEVIDTEFRKGASVQTGVKAFLSDSSVATGGQVFPGMDMTLSSNSINSLLKNFDKTGLVNLGRVSTNFYVTLQALEQNNVLKLRSTPQLSTLNGNEANLTIGQSVYYLEQTQNINPGVNPISVVSQRFNKVEANLNLVVKPFVSGNNHITMSIEAEFSDFIPAEVDGAPPGNATRKFLSKIRVKDGEMIVLGGLEEARKSNSGSGLPFLSRIPILKWFFSSRSTENNESELLIFIRPTVIW